ncbi:ubiquinol-cytochrome-c reductase complex assembly factor 2-like [Physella acuta]|uniref:ubiquinol-cytochrome-c reductase complex assembly factor 2-like n=1 Tax=Physella acuta TaxID=109671 RepID=UPI0027DC4207|nr:ubiquinol-cytochrome-c reductase complex assembly factor 2-like [Physella acuta]
MAASRYRNFLHLFEQWPLDKSIGNRDLGLLIRKRILEKFPKGEASTINEAECDVTYVSLQKLVNDLSRKRWARAVDSNATGSTYNDLNSALSEQSLKEFENEGNKKLFIKLKEKLRPPRS